MSRNLNKKDIQLLLDVWQKEMQAVSEQMDMAIRMALLTAPDVHDEPVAWMTHHDEPMLFLAEKEAAAYCDDDESPIPLFSDPQPDVSELQAECENLRTALAESRANDRQAMYYLNQVREIVGGDDFPDMVGRCRELMK